MSYDLMVFDPKAAPTDRAAFLAWYKEQTEWAEDHTYDDPAVTTEALRAWFFDMLKHFPAMNGPHAARDDASVRVSDYCIGRSVIYVAFAWSEAGPAFEAVMENARKTAWASTTSAAAKVRSGYLTKATASACTPTVDHSRRKSGDCYFWVGVT